MGRRDIRVCAYPRAKSTLLKLTFSSMLLLFLTFSNAYGAPPAGYLYRVKITIAPPAGCGTGNLTDFPILIQRTNTFLRPIGSGGLLSNTNGYDVVFTAANGNTLLDFQLDHYFSATGEYAAWVRIPSLSLTASTDIYMYYGNPAVTTNQSTTATWNTAFRTVYHFQSDSFTDGTSNAVNGTNTGTTNAAATKIGGGRSFDGVTNYIQSGASTVLKTANNFTISTWFKAANTNPAHILYQGQPTGVDGQNGWGDGDAATTNGQELHISTGTCCGATGGFVSAFLGHTDEQQTTDVLIAQEAFTNTTTWHYLVATMSNLNTGTPTVNLYLDGALVDTNSGLTAAVSRANLNNFFTIGRPVANTRFYTGELDETRISDVTRPDNWICAEYSNQNNPGGWSTFVNVVPSLGSMENPALNFNEDAAPITITANTAITDENDGYMNGATIVISANYSSSEDVLAFTNANGITGTWNAGTGTLTLSGSATLANYQTALRSVTYQNTNTANPSIAVRTVTFSVTDPNAGTSNTVSRDIGVTRVNDAPALANTEASVIAYTEGQAATIVTPLTTVVDVDNTNLTGATVTISSGYLNTEDVLAFTNAFGITGAWNATTGVLTLSGTTTPANYQSAIRTITYQNTNGNNPSGAVRTISFRANDGTALSNIATRNINVTPVNDLPVLSNMEAAALAYTEGQGATALTSNTSVADADNASLSSATITISTGYLNTEDVLAFTNANGISGSWNSTTGVLTLSGTATVANYQTAIRSVTYQNTNNSNPSPVTRTVQVFVHDGTGNSNTVSRNITITNVNPFYTLIGNTAEISTHCFTITPAINSSIGALWRKVPTTMHTSFEINFDARFSASGVVNDGGADGIVFILQRDVTPPPSNAAGSPTDALGASGTGLGYGGISPSIAVTFDTYTNASQPAYDFISLSKDGNVGTLLTGVVAAKVDGSNNPVNIEDGAYHTVKITWQKSTNTLKVSFDGNERVTYSEDFINTVFGGDPSNIYWGFTAATGGFNNEQSVCGLNMNFSPTTVADAYTVSEGGTINQAAPGVLANDTDAEGGTLTAVLGTTTTNGTLTLNANGSFTYVHNGSETTSDSFTYRVSDGSALGDFVTVSITVTPVNDTPVAANNAYTTNEDTPLTVVLANSVLVNDTDGEGSPLTAVLNAGPSNGTLTLNANGTFTYTPNANYNGNDTFTYRANDGTANSNIATVTITVSPVNDAPVAVNDAYSTNEDTPLTVVLANRILLNDTDAEASALTAILDAGPANGTLTLNANGTFTYTPNANYNGSDNFTYHANDGTANSNIATVTITVNAVNDVPVAVNDAYTTNEDTPLTVVLANRILLNDTDVEGSALTAILDVGPANGTLTLNANGTFTYTPNANYNGNDTFTYHANDGTGNSNIATVTITVSPVNDAPVAANDAYSTNEDTPLTIVLANRILLNDTDVEASALTAVLDAGPANGTLTLNANGTFTYTPNANYNGSDNFTYHANDGTANSNIATVTITVNAVNDVPVAVNDAYTTNEDTPLTVVLANRILLNDTDVEGSALTAILDVGPSNGTLTLNANGTFTYTPNANYNGNDSFTYHANDGTGNSNIATVTITINAVNDVPVAVNDAYTTNEDTPLTVVLANRILLNDTDVEGNALTAILDVGPANGTLTLNANGTFTYTPNANHNGSDSFTYHANDGTGNSNIATVTITVTPVNDPPVAVNDAYTTNEDTPLVVVLANRVLANDTDVEGSALTAVLDVGPAHGTLTLNANGTFTFTPTANYNGNDSFTYHANDGTGNSNIATVTITINAVNDAPVAVNNGYTTNEDTPLTVALANGILVNDTDVEGNALTAVLDVGPSNGTLTLNANGTFTYTPNANYNGSDSFTYHANDGTGNSNIATVTITINAVNDVPVAVNNSYTTNEDTPLTVVLANSVLANDTDVEGSALTAVLDAGPSNGTLTLNTNGTFTYTPNANYNGNDSFTYHANDGTGNSNIATVTITINAVNDVPVAVNDAYTTNEDTPLTVVLANRILLNDTDVEGNALTAVPDAGPSNGTLTLNANGTFTYTPSANFNGNDTFTYHANDGTGNSNIATVTITVTPVNDPPVAVNDAYTTNEDTPLVVVLANRVLANDTDVEGSALTAVLDVGPAHGTLTLNTNGTFTFTPTANYNGNDSFTYHANDGTGNSNIATVTITINAVNDAPVAVNNGYTTNEDTPLTVVLANGILVNDTDVEGNALTAVLDVGPANGTLTLNANGTFTYTPNTNYNGSDSFTYHANDGTGNSNIATVTITINAVNDLPVAVNNAYTTNEDTPLTVVLANSVLVNDTDVEGNTLTAVLDVGPANGTLTLNANGTFTYTPSANYNGSDTFTYHANDGTGNSNIATVTITVTPVNDAPVAADDAYTTNEDTPLTVVLANRILLNDTDVEGNAFTAVLDVGPANGTLTLNANGTFTYTPNANYNGNDSFTYHANDGTGNSNIATVTITVNAVNDVPVAVNDAYTTNEDTPLTVVLANRILLNDTDAEGNTLTAILGVGPVNGTLTLNANGTFTYTPNTNYSGSDTFTYHANDGTGNSNIATVTITVTPVNDAPVAANDAYTTNEDTPLSVILANRILLNDTDVEGNALTAILNVGPANGTLTLNANGTFTYTPNANYNGSDNFTYHANDGTGNSNIATVTITVSLVNDLPVAVNNAYAATEDTPLTVVLANSVLVNDTDAEGSALTAVLDAGPSNGTLTLNANGTFTYTPNANYTGGDSFTYHAHDGTGNSNIATVTITVSPVNDPPVAVNDAYTTNEDTPLTIALANSVLVNDTDPEGNTLTAVLDVGPSNGTLTLNANGTFTYSPAANYNGSDSFTYHANDGTGNSNIATVTITVSPVNDAPVAVSDAYTTNEDTPLTVALANSVLGNDTDVEASPLTAVLNVGPANGTLTLNANGTFTYTPNANYSGSDTFTYHANDGTGNSNIATVTITVSPVNDAPVAVNDAYTTNEDAPLTVALANRILLNDTDAEGSALTAILDAGPANGTLVLNGNGTFTYTPNANYSGSDTFTYHANDGTGNSNLATVTITVSPVNDAPVAVNDAYTTNEDTPLTVVLANSVLTNDNDVEASTLTAVLNVGPTNGTLTLNTNGTFTYTPNANYSGSDTFTYHANDGTGNSNIATVTITVSPVNDTPVAVNDAYTTNEDTPLTTTLANSVLVNDTDAEGNTLTAVPDAGPSNGTLTLNANGTFTYTPAGNYNGSDTFTYHVNDGTSDSNIATVSITINAVNDVPVAVNDAYTTDEDTPLTATLANGILLNDSDVEGSALTAVLNAGPANGTLTLNANGTFTYTPAANYNGNDTFTYHVNDGTGNSNLATVAISVIDFNDAPVVVNDAYTTNEDTPLAATSVLVNDTDSEGNPLTAVLDAGPANGTLTLNADGTFNYTPVANFNGNDSFTYHANDGTSNSNLATVTITVSPVNDAPVAANDAYGTNEDTPLTAVLANSVLANDMDAESSTLTAVLDAGPANGTLTLNADGTFTYTPATNYTGDDTFTYHVNDGTVNSNIATVTITITPVNEPPVAVDDGPILHNSFLPITIDALANDGDPNDALEDLTIISVSTANLGSVSIENGMIVYKPSGLTSGTVTFTYTIQDPGGLTSSATITIFYEYFPLEVSQGFSPNNAGGNETWYIRSIESYPDNRISVFDRWGILVFEAKHYDNNSVFWDGRANTGMLSGKNLDQGTYYYVIDLGTEEKELTGYVMIVR